MYDAKKAEERKEKVQKYNCIMDRSYFNNDMSFLLNVKSSHIPNENTFY